MELRFTPPRQAFALAPHLRGLVRTLQERRARTVADRELARRLHAAVERSGLGVHGLALYVHDGTIAVYGPVRDEATREAVFALAAEQPGARRIIDHTRLGD